jgi:MFS family permease
VSAKTHRKDSPRGLASGIVAYARAFTDVNHNARQLLAATTFLWIGLGIFGVLFNLYLIDIGYSVAFVGLLAAVGTVGQASASLILGSVLRRWPARTVMLFSTAVTAASMAATAVFTQAALLVVATAIQGIAVAAATIPSSPYIMEQSTVEQRAHLFSSSTAATSFGSFLGSLMGGAAPAIGIVIASLRGHAVLQDRAGLVIGAAITGIGVWFYWKATDDRVDEDDRLQTPETVGAPEEDSDDRTRGDVIAMMAASALIAVSLGVIYPLFNVYFATVHHASTATIGVIYAFSGVFCTVAVLVGPIFARRGTLSGLVAMRLLSAPVLLSFWAHPGLSGAFSAYIARNILGTISGVLENNFAMEAVPARLRGAVASWRAFSFNAGWTAGSLVAGLVVARYGFDSVFVASAVLTLAGCFTWYRRFGPQSARVRFPLHAPAKKH